MDWEVVRISFFHYKRYLWTLTLLGLFLANSLLVSASASSTCETSYDLKGGMFIPNTDCWKQDNPNYGEVTDTEQLVQADLGAARDEFTNRVNGADLTEYIKSQSHLIKDQEAVIADMEFDKLGSQQGQAYESNGWWLPDGFFDGPSQQDLGYQALRYVFGEPVMKAYTYVTKPDPNNPAPTIIAPSDPSYRATLGLSYAQMMNTIGILLIGGVLGVYIFTFFVKRSIEVGYLKGDEKEETLFGFVRGSGALIGSMPLQAFYGLSSFQMTTICCVLLGLGMSSSIIKYSVGNILTPSIVATEYPAMNDFIDSLLLSKVCVNKLRSEFDSNTSNNVAGSRGHVQGSYLYFEATDKITQNVSYFSGLTSGKKGLSTNTTKTRVHKFYIGPAAECGVGDIGRLHQETKKLDEFDNAYTAISTFAESAMADMVYELVPKIWSDLDYFAPEIVKDDFQLAYVMGDPSKGKKAIKMSREYANMKYMYSRIMTQRIHNLLKDLYDSPIIVDVNNSSSTTSINAVRDSIARVGMFGLGSTYITQAQMQDSFSDPVENAFQPIKDINFTANRISWYSGYVTVLARLKELWDRDNTALADAKERYKVFVSSPYSAGSQDLLTSSINNLTEPSRFGVVEHIVRKAAISTYSYLATGDLSASNLNHAAVDPILQLRNLGRTVQNTALAFWLVPTVWDYLSGNYDEDQLEADNEGNTKHSETPNIIVLLVYGLFSWGFVMCNVVPYIPYVMWTIACFSYLSFASMAILGTGWWGGGMALKGHSNESLMGKSQEGINILISLVIRPPLMTIGFFTALVLNKVLGFVVNATIQPAMISANAGITNPLMMLGLFIITSLILIIGIYKNMSLIWELTDLFTKWIGLDRDHLSEDGAKQSLSQFMAKGEAGGGKVTSLMKGMAGGPKGQLPFQ